MSFRGRPSLSGTPGRSSLQPSSPSVDLGELRRLLLSARDLPCFETRPECQIMIDDVLTSCLPVAAMAESALKAGPESSAFMDANGVSLPAAPLFSDGMTVDDPDWESVAPNPKQIQLVSSPGPFFGRRGSGGSSSNASGNLSRGAVSRRASGAGMVDRIGISRMPDRAWTIALDYLELGEGMRCRQLGRVFRNTVEASLSVLALSGVNSITWATPANLAFLTRFKNVRTLHWYVGVGMPSKAEKNAAAAAAAAAEAVIGRDEGDPPAQNDIDNAAKIVAADRYGAAAGEGALRVADCNPVRTWAYLLGALPKIEEVIIVEGAETDEMALEEVWLHLLPLCRNLRSFFLNFEDYSQCPVDGDHPPINVKKFAVFLQAKKPFPRLRELHLELGSMSIAEQRSLVRGLNMSGLLPQLEKVTLGEGTTSYVRSPGRGPGRDLFAAFKKNPCVRLKVLWLQRLDLWDDLDALATALGPSYCPVLEELFLDLALDADDVANLAKCLHKFPSCLKTLGVLAVAIKDRTPDGLFAITDPTQALQMLSDALSDHPRPNLQCLDVSLHFEPPPNDELPEEPLQLREFQARSATKPIMALLASGKLTGLKHVQLSSCSLDDVGLLNACEAVSKMKGIQTLDLSSNQLSTAGAGPLAKALCHCRSLHEIVLEESVELNDSDQVIGTFKKLMPWVTVRVEDRDLRRGMARRSFLPVGQAAEPFFADADEELADADEDEDDHSHNSAMAEGDPQRWDSVDPESDGEVPPELMGEDSSDE